MTDTHQWPALEKYLTRLRCPNTQMQILLHVPGRRSTEGEGKRWQKHINDQHSKNIWQDCAAQTHKRRFSCTSWEGGGRGEKMTDTQSMTSTRKTSDKFALPKHTNADSPANTGMMEGEGDGGDIKRGSKRSRADSKERDRDKDREEGRTRSRRDKVCVFVCVRACVY
jgi:hypothetical protein